MGRKKVGRRPKRLTKRQRKFVENVAAGESDKEAALKAGFAPSVADNVSYKLWSKPQIQTYYRDLLRDLAPPEDVARRVREHMDGRSIETKVRRKFGPPDKDGKRAVLEEVVERTEKVNADVSLRACEDIMEAAEYVPKKGPQIELNLTNFQMMTYDQLREIVERGKERFALLNAAP